MSWEVSLFAFLIVLCFSFIEVCLNKAGGQGEDTYRRTMPSLSALANYNLQSCHELSQELFHEAVRTLSLSSSLVAVPSALTEPFFADHLHTNCSSFVQPGTCTGHEHKSYHT